MIRSKAARAVAFLGATSAFCAATVLFAQIAPKAARPPRVVSPRSTLGPPAVTFNNKVVRILQANCQKCHHEGGIAPFPLMTYDDALARKTDIVYQTGQRKMPPWHIDSSCAAYQGDPALSAADIQTLASWAASGAPEGDAKDLPPPLTFDNGWSLGQPDQVLTMAEPFKPNFIGGDIYRCFVLPTGLTEDRFVRAVEIAPGSRQIVHHVLLFLDTSGAADRLDQQDPGPGYSCFGGPGFDVSATAPSLGGWAPGKQRDVPRTCSGLELQLAVHLHLQQLCGRPVRHGLRRRGALRQFERQLPQPQQTAEGRFVG